MNFLSAILVYLFVFFLLITNTNGFVITIFSWSIETRVSELIKLSLLSMKSAIKIQSIFISKCDIFPLNRIRIYFPFIGEKKVFKQNSA